MKNTLLTVLKKKGYSINLNNNDILFFNSMYSINLSINNTSFNLSINRLSINFEPLTTLIDFNNIPFDIKLIRSWLDSINNIKTDYLFTEFNEFTLLNDKTLKICYNDLYYLIEDYLIELFTNSI